MHDEEVTMYPEGTEAVTVYVPGASALDQNVLLLLKSGADELIVTPCPMFVVKLFPLASTKRPWTVTVEIGVGVGVAEAEVETLHVARVPPVVRLITEKVQVVPDVVNRTFAVVWVEDKMEYPLLGLNE